VILKPREGEFHDRLLLKRSEVATATRSRLLSPSISLTALQARATRASAFFKRKESFAWRHVISPVTLALQLHRDRVKACYAFLDQLIGEIEKPTDHRWHGSLQVLGHSKSSSVERSHSRSASG
jgi:hypothetical protein